MSLVSASIVIAAAQPGPVLRDCLAALEAQRGRERAEIIVATSEAGGIVEHILREFPDVRTVHPPGAGSVPYLRGAAIDASRGPIVAIIDPFCIVQGDWLNHLLRLHAERPEPAIGGAVELEGGSWRGSLVRWATYLSEYAAFSPPVPSGPVPELTGNNISYKRWALGEVGTLARRGFWKTFVNRRLRAEGHGLWSAPELLVTLRKDIPLVEFLRSRYHHGRCFAARRVSASPVFVRLLRAATTPALPVLASWRDAARIWPKRRYRGRFVLVAPLLLLFQANWAWGELWGYLRGAQASCTQLRY